MSPRVVLDNATITYSRGGANSFTVDVSITAEPNRVTCLLGMSGSGKTSVLKLIAGLLKPEKGTIYLGDKCVNNLPPSERGVCVVFQTPSLLPYKTVLENVIFAMRKTPEQEKRGIAMELLSNINMASHANKYTHELSMGQQQRVALARAFASGSDIMLLDEPFSNLDVESGAQAREHLALLIKRHARTVILVTHSAAEAMMLGDHIYVIDRGKVAQSGTPRDLYYNPCDFFVARFFGPLNMLNVKTDEYGNVLLPFAACLRTKFENAEVVLGIRHESIILATSTDLECSTAVVLDVRFFGSHDLVRLMFCGGDILHMRCEANDQRIRVGCPVRVKFDWGSVIVLNKPS